MATDRFAQNLTVAGPMFELTTEPKVIPLLVDVVVVPLSFQSSV